MPFQRILEHIRYSPWFCTVSAYQSMSDVVDICMTRMKAGGSLDPKMEGISLSDLQSRREMTVDGNGIAHIHVLGVMGRGLAPIEKCCGRTDYADLDKETEKAQQVARAALFEFDTPGGSAIGVDQTAQRIGQMSIPTAAFCDSTVASAGYYLAAGVDRMFLGSGAVAGCIGTILPWRDTSEQAALSGVKTKVFTNQGADLKGIRPDVELSPEQEAHLQEWVDQLGTAFKNHIENYRSPDASVYRAGSYIGQSAADLNLVDEIGGKAEAVQYLLTRLRS